MTSEGPHRPGQEPDEVPPGGGGPAPYGDRPAQQDNGYGATAPDLGWAPPPPARPEASTPGWANQQGGPWGNAQATRQAEPPTPGAWDQPAGSQPSWLAQGDQPQQPAPGWAPAAPSTSEQPAWANGAQTSPAQTSPAWATESAPADAGQPGEWTPSQPASGQPDWATNKPDWATNQPAASGQPDWATNKPASGQPGGWGGGQQSEWTPAPRTGDQTPGWATPASQPEPAQPDWAQVEPPMPARAEPVARATAQVPQADPALPHRPATDGAARAEGWPAEQQEQPGWATGQRREPAANGWAPEQPAEGWQTSGDRPAQPDWAATPAPGEPTGWAGGNPAAGPPPTWSPTAEPLPSRSTADRSLPDIEPWSAGEAWGRAGAAETTPPKADAEPEAARAEEVPVYQPAPAPGISPANMVPLPPQEQRVPGASLGAASPTDYGQPPPFTDDQAGQGARPGVDQAAAAMGWGQPESRHDEPQSPAGPVIPAPRTSPEAEGRPTPPAAGGVAASASVPLASRVMPPADHSLRPTGSSTPQPRVYGRPARAEQAEEPAQEQDEQPLVPRFDQGPERFDQGPERFDQGPESRFTDPQPPAGGRDAFAGPAAPASPAAPPAFPPGIPSFVDAPPSNRPLNGVRPHAEPERPADPFGGPPGDRFGGSGNDPFGGPPGRPGGTYGAPVRPETGSEHNSAFPPPPQSAPPWSPGPSTTESEQGRFDAFKPVAEPAPEAPAPKVRNGRVLAAVLVAAVLILAIPLGLLLLLGMIGGSEETGAFDPPVGSCVKRSGESAVAAECTEAEAFTVVSKVESKDKCPDPVMPHVDLRGSTANPVLCLKQATGG
ncbi:hypothetical protein SAMN05443287_107263 [Micromonospora phaseoli]|uniref:Uncharacterized protein n=1 Tax=Micromonospora phaseoli TaxID=1144548 RepID=A0A1H7BQ62_9ACTN|nr:hypothetical protein [Micromonospora phaseoli]PZV94965.1 hypothetical protein CLV64_108100 [Micromonospora phaseoli]GIJ79891.1 hypothetical protein Xph01_43230 [Micromonospora phaseoli]SEJ76722.1 hypothetical protein SAMN05443287_107263 [Micromonospora phaseoli]